MAKKTGTLERARELIGFRRFQEAEKLVSAALSREPLDPDLNLVMGDIMGFQRRVADSEAYVRQAIRLRPGDGRALMRLGELLMATARRDEAFEALESAVAALNGTVEVFEEYASLMQMYWLLDRAVDVFRRGLEKHPWNPTLVGLLSVVLMKSGCPEETVELMRQAAERHPDDQTLVGMRAFSLNYPAGVSPEETLAAHKAYGELLAKKFPAQPHHRPGKGESERRLRVGFVSSDLRQHACAFFCEPVIAGLDKNEFATCCYYVGDAEDARTLELKRHAAMWRHCPTADAAALARRIRDDRMDVLVDLSGLTGGSRLETFALRAAPVQMTYLGYPNTTGVPSMDYRIVDSITDPVGAERHATEKLLRIDPCFLCYAGMEAARVMPGPAAPSRNGGVDGPVTFGSFNALQKTNDALLRLWARVVNATPGSRLAVKYLSMGDEGTRERLRGRLNAAGISPERVVLFGPKNNYQEHLESYSEVDIALDTFPYNGTTTTCEALWMGVPVVTLASLPDIHRARVGASLLAAVGLGDLVARGEDEFVRIASTLAADRARRATLRADLRETMKHSPLCDRAEFGKRFGAAVRSAWREWCGA